MAKSLKILLLSVFSIIGLLVAPFLALAGETLTITTYYPSPYGSYKKLTTNVITTNVITTQRYASADTSIDWADGNVQSVSVSGSAGATFTFTGGEDGAKYILILKYNATGTGAFTWPGTVRWSGGTAPTLTRTLNKTDYIGFIYSAIDNTYDGIATSLNF
jgi:hypothetical protein